MTEHNTLYVMALFILLALVFNLPQIISALYDTRDSRQDRRTSHQSPQR